MLQLQCNRIKRGQRRERENNKVRPKLKHCTAEGRINCGINVPGAGERVRYSVDIGTLRWCLLFQWVEKEEHSAELNWNDIMQQTNIQKVGSGRGEQMQTDHWQQHFWHEQTMRSWAAKAVFCCCGFLQRSPRACDGARPQHSFSLSDNGRSLGRSYWQSNPLNSCHN